MERKELVLIRNQAPVKAFLASSGLTQREFSKMVDMPESYFSQVVNGRQVTALESVERIAKLVECNVWTLVLPPELTIVESWEAAFTHACRTFIRRVSHGPESE